MIEGIDISRHQGSIDMRRVFEEGYTFVIAKASEGVGHVDPMFDRHVRAAKAQGLTVGAYHFARPDSIGTPEDAKAEALDFVTAIRSVGGLGPTSLPPAIDFEKYGPNGPVESVAWLETFVRVVECELGTSPMIYTGRNVWRFEVGNSDAFKHLPLWVVAYSARAIDPEATAPSIPGLGPAVLWQWSGGGKFAHGPKVAGVRCDLNRFVGDDWVDLITPQIRRPG